VLSLLSSMVWVDDEAAADRCVCDLRALQRREGWRVNKEALCKAMGSAIGYDEAANEREIVFLLQASPPA
jgi:hypothetical protein